MIRAVAAACLLVLCAHAALAGERPRAAATGADPAAARRELETLRGQEKRQDAEVRALKARVDTLESHSKTAGEAIEERDRRIAELQRQLEAARGH